MNATRFQWTQKPPVGHGLDPSSPLAQGLGVCLAFNEPAPSGAGVARAYDLCGGPAIALSGSLAWRGGKYGSALAGTGTDQYGVQQYAAINDARSLTVAMLWRCPSGQPQFGRVLEKGVNGEWYFDYEVGSGNKLTWFCRMGATNAQVDSPGALFDGNWHQVVGTRDYATGLCTLYADGDAVASTTQSVPAPASTGDLHLWQFASSQGSFYTQSSFAGVWVANRCWTRDEVASHYVRPWQMFEAPTTRRWFAMPAAVAPGGLPLFGGGFLSSPLVR